MYVDLKFLKLILKKINYKTKFISKKLTKKQNLFQKPFI